MRGIIYVVQVLSNSVRPNVKARPGLSPGGDESAIEKPSAEC